MARSLNFRSSDRAKVLDLCPKTTRAMLGAQIVPFVNRILHLDQTPYRYMFTAVLTALLKSVPKSLLAPADRRSFQISPFPCNTVKLHEKLLHPQGAPEHPN
jgi:hypothetical protein